MQRLMIADGSDVVRKVGKRILSVFVLVLFFE